ncbi:MAG: acyl-[acyl-carrier-protein] thioesterase [Acidimicrobiales bacterium]
MTPRPTAGRLYRAERRVRLSDADASGRVRRDAVARYLHDVAGDDLTDSGVGTRHETWVVRRTVIEVESPPRFGELLSVATWCSGLGGRWAERRTSLVGEHGGRVETASLWVYLDRRTLAPSRLSDDFLAMYGPSAGGRKVSSRFQLAWTPPAEAPATQWPVRATDIDVMGHVNNAAYWAAVEEVAASSPLEPPVRVTLEHGAGIDLGEKVELAVDRGTIWFVVDGEVRAVASTSRQ